MIMLELFRYIQSICVYSCETCNTSFKNCVKRRAMRSVPLPKRKVFKTVNDKLISPPLFNLPHYIQKLAFITIFCDVQVSCILPRRWKYGTKSPLSIEARRSRTKKKPFHDKWKIYKYSFSSITFAPLFVKVHVYPSRKPPELRVGL